MISSLIDTITNSINDVGGLLFLGFIILVIVMGRKDPGSKSNKNSNNPPNNS